MKKRNLIMALMCLAVADELVAQNTTSTPVSMYGIGELATSDGGKYAGLGGAGIALNRAGLMNTQNPACLTRMDTTCFFYDFGVTASFSSYRMWSERSEAGTGNLSRLSLGVRLLPRWYVMVGASPYSSVGYMIRSEQEVDGMDGEKVSSLFEGTGGLYRLYLTNSFLIGRHFSLGFNIGMISGTVEQTETQENAVVTRKSEKGAFYADFGLHYAMGKHWSVGAIYGLSTRLKQKNNLAYENSSTDEDLDVKLYTDRQYIPQCIGFGMTYETVRWTLTGDCSWRQWSRNPSSVTSVEYIDQYQGNVGLVYVTSPRKPRSTELMLGVGYGNSYIQLKQGKMYNLDLSAGASFPFRETAVSLGLTWRRQMNTRSSLMQESRLTLNLNVTFGERLSRGKIQ